MKSKPKTHINGGEGQFTLNDINRFSVPNTNRVSNNNNSPLPEGNGNNTNLAQEVGDIRQKMDQVLGLLSKRGEQPTPHPQEPPVTEATEDPDIVRRSRRIVD